MILQAWAERLLHAPCSPEVIDLHVQDTLAAFFCGARTGDGRALSKLYGRHADGTAAAASAIARLSECDDIHLASCVTPGSVVIPIALACTQKSSEQDFHRAVAAGYAAGLGLGLAIGGAKALAHGVWPTLLAAPVMAAVTASSARGHEPSRLAHAVALALSGASGRLGRPTGVPSGRWFALGEAVAKGIAASEAAGQGFCGDLALISKEWLRVQAGHDEISMEIFGTTALPPSILDVGFKPFPIARQAVNAVTAFQSLLAKSLDPNRIETIEVFVPHMNVALLSRTVAMDDRLSRLSNMGYQLACAALAPAMLYDCERQAPPNIGLMEFARLVSVSPAADMDAHLPDHWPARLVVKTGGKPVEETLVGAPFDHDAPGLTEKLNDKWQRLLSQDARGFFDDAVQRKPSGIRAVLWQIIERHVSMRAQLGNEPKPAQG